MTLSPYGYIVDPGSGKGTLQWRGDASVVTNSSGIRILLTETAKNRKSDAGQPPAHDFRCPLVVHEVT